MIQRVAGVVVTELATSLARLTADKMDKIATRRAKRTTDRVARQPARPPVRQGQVARQGPAMRHGPVQRNTGWFS